MRTIREVRDQKLGQLRAMIERPEMWAVDGRAMQTLACGVVEDLCFIDERDDEFAAQRNSLTLYGKLGVIGAFEAVFGDDCAYGAEVASVFAHIAVRLGYAEPQRRLSQFEFGSLVSATRSRYEEVDLRASNVIEDWGEPSLVIGKRVLCYVGSTADEWVSFDCWEESRARYSVEGGGFRRERVDDPLLRDVRVPADSFNQSLILTTYGKVLRWGPGWWLRVQPARVTRPADGAREQLQFIEASDASQSLGPRRP